MAARVRYNGPSFEGSFDGSLDGRVLVFVPGARTASTLMWFDRKGQPLGRVGPDQNYRNLAVFPDGRTAAVELADTQYGTRDLWLMDLKTNALTRLTTNPATRLAAGFVPGREDDCVCVRSLRRFHCV